MSIALPLSTVSTSSNIAVVRQVLEGDLRALELLMRHHNRVMFRTARAILKDDAEAEDAVQEAYLQAYRSLANFRGDACLSTWLTRIVANEAFGRLRKRGRRAAILPLHSDDETLPEPEAGPEAPAMDRPDNTAMRSEMRRLIEARIDELPDVYRVVFVLRAVEELSVPETAACLGIPESTVRTRFFRARSLLREALALDIDRASGDAFGFAGERCDRIVANVLTRLAPEARVSD
ncbi:MAG TPA: RNA polymerase sigma factor [Casimicrobiaceae bacterium]|nr:RNA polymerase sigma factor [Casimicrobiaceae bacterium]